MPDASFRNLHISNNRDKKAEKRIFRHEDKTRIKIKEQNENSLQQQNMGYSDSSLMSLLKKNYDMFKGLTSNMPTR